MEFIRVLFRSELETSLITNQMIHAKESRLATANNESGRMLFSNRESYANQLEAQAFTNLNKVTTSGLHGVSGTSFNDAAPAFKGLREGRSEEHTSELQSLMRISYAVFCLKKKTSTKEHTSN